MCDRDRCCVREDGHPFYCCDKDGKILSNNIFCRLFDHDWGDWREFNGGVKQRLCNRRDCATYDLYVPGSPYERVYADPQP